MDRDNRGIKQLLIRLSADILLCVSLLFFPWWISASLAVVFLFAFRSYYEVLAFGFIYDSLYATALPTFQFFSFPVSVISALAFLLVYMLRDRLVFYRA